VRRSFTLLEILLTLVVLAIGLLGVISLLPPALTTADHVARSHEVCHQARVLQDALQAAALDPRVRLDAGGEVESLCLVLRHPAAEDELAFAADEQLFGSRACLLLPHGVDKVFSYPRGEVAAEIARANGQGTVALARDDRALSAEARSAGSSYSLPRADRAARVSFKLELQRAWVAGAARDDLYHVSLRFFVESADGERQPLQEFSSELYVPLPPRLPRSEGTWRVEELNAAADRLEQEAKRLAEGER